MLSAPSKVRIVVTMVGCHAEFTDNAYWLDYWSDARDVSRYGTHIWAGMQQQTAVCMLLLDKTGFANLHVCFQMHCKNFLKNTIGCLDLADPDDVFTFSMYCFMRVNESTKAMNPCGWKYINHRSTYSFTTNCFSSSTQQLKSSCNT